MFDCSLTTLRRSPKDQVSAVKGGRHEGCIQPLGRYDLPLKDRTVTRLAGSQARAIVARLNPKKRPRRSSSILLWFLPLRAR